MVKLLLKVVLLSTLLTAFSCSSDDPSPVPDNKIETKGENFDLSVDAISTNRCALSCQPHDAAMTYTCKIVEKEKFDEFETDWDLQMDDLALFEAWAAMDNVALETLLATELFTGPVEDFAEGLSPATEYYLYAYGMTFSGEFTTGIDKVLFKTRAVDRVDVTFDIRISELTPSSFTMAVTASDPKADFFFSLMEEEWVAQWKDKEEACEEYLAWIVRYYTGKGASVRDIYEHFVCHGSDQDVFDKLRPEKTYYAFAVGITPDFQVNSKPAIEEVVTKALTPSDNTFAVELEQITFNSVSGTITPSNDDQYFWTVQRRIDVEGAPSEEELMWGLAEMYEENGMLDDALHTGLSKIEGINYLSPDSDYCLLVFGWKEGPTTALTRKDFRTAPAEANAEDLVVEFEVSGVTYNSATVVTRPNIGVYYYSDVIEAEVFEQRVAEAGDRDAAIVAMLDESLSWGAEFAGCEKPEWAFNVASIGEDSYTYDQLEAETGYVVMAVSLDLETGEAAYPKGFVSEVFTTKERIVSDASVTFVAGDYYDGDELADIDFEKYGRMRGKAVLCYELQPNASAYEWVSSIEYGDATEWGLSDDDIINMLITWGGDNVRQNARSGVYVCDWETTFSCMAIALDINGNFGHAVISPFTLEKSGVSPAREFIDSQEQTAAVVGTASVKAVRKPALRRVKLGAKPAAAPAVTPDRRVPEADGMPRRVEQAQRAAAMSRFAAR